MFKEAKGYFINIEILFKRMNSKFVVFIAALLFGTITVGGQFFANLGFSVYEISIFTLLSMIILLLPLSLNKFKEIIKKDLLWFFLLLGLMGAFMHLGQYASIVLGVPVAVVALVLYSQPIWTTLFGRFILKEKIRK